MATMQKDSPFQIFIHLPDASGAVPAAQARFTDSEGLEVSYGRGYLRRRNAMPIDPASLPLGPARTVLEPGRLGAVRDALPDWWGRTVIARLLGRNAEDLRICDCLPFGGPSRTGNLDFRRPQDEDRPDALPPPSSEADRLLDAAARLERNLPVGRRSLELLAQGCAVGGSRPKCAMLHEGLPWIAKFPAAGDRWPAARIEKASMELAAACGIEIPELRLLDAGGRDVLLVRRFDREPVPGGFARRGYLSALSLCRWTERERPLFSYMAVADAAAAMDVRDLPQIFRRMAFNVLCRNTDDHPRNHGFLADGNSLSPAPAFDIVPSPSVRGVGTHVSHAMDVGVRGGMGTVPNVLSCAERFGLSPVQAEGIIAGMLARISAWRDFFERNGVREETAERFRWSFERWREDRDALELLERHGA